MCAKSIGKRAFCANAIQNLPVAAPSKALWAQNRAPTFCLTNRLALERQCKGLKTEIPDQWFQTGLREVSLCPWLFFAARRKV